MSGDILACICNSGSHKRDTWSSLNLSKLSVLFSLFFFLIDEVDLDVAERIANGGGHFECFGRKGN